MVDKVQLKKDFDDNGLSPHELHVKYEIDIETVYIILKEEDED